MMDKKSATDRISERIGELLDHKAHSQMEPMGSITVDYMLQEIYETETDLCNHNQEEAQYGDAAALALITMHPGEDVVMDPWANLFNQYVSKQVHEFSHLSFLEFIRLPFAVGEMIIEQCVRFAAQTTSALANLDHNPNR